MCLLMVLLVSVALAQKTKKATMFFLSWLVQLYSCHLTQPWNLLCITNHTEAMLTKLVLKMIETITSASTSVSRFTWATVAERNKLISIFYKKSLLLKEAFLVYI